MIILFNPKEGAEIKDFIVEGVGRLEPHPVGALRQYEDNVGKIILEQFGFLREVTATEAQTILAKPQEPSFKCQYCDFTTDYKVALAGHMRKHTEEIAQAKEPVVNPDIIPVATAQKVEVKTVPEEKEIDNIPNGTDKDGVAWYGEGVTEENNSAHPLPKMGQAHFGG